jgi:hypothetical protein
MPYSIFPAIISQKTDKSVYFSVDQIDRSVYFQ